MTTNRDDQDFPASGGSEVCRIGGPAPGFGDTLLSVVHTAERPEGTETLASDVTPRPLGVIIRAVDGKGQPASFRLSSGACVLGAGADCDVVVTDTTVSRRHASLELVAEGVSVRNLGSRNGTFYLGQRFSEMRLGLGAQFTIGATAIAIEADEEALRTGHLFAHPTYRDIVGSATVMRRLFAVLERLEGSLASILVTGESGTGKELVARALHAGSRVSNGPMVSLNCGALPRDLVASVLFGHRRGAFTGAVDSRKGAFESADGGTLFLDEIGELPLEAQPFLLRAIETGEVRPIGGEPRNVTVRLVAATNRDLFEEVTAGRFREDLYYRIAVVKLDLPSLRERMEDIEPLSLLFAAEAGIGELPVAVVEQLKARAYRGNVRELRNAVHAYAALGALPQQPRRREGELELLFSDLIDVSRPFIAQKNEIVDRFTRVYMQALLTHTGGNQSQAARLADVDRGHLGKLLGRLRGG